MKWKSSILLCCVVGVLSLCLQSCTQSRQFSEQEEILIMNGDTASAMRVLMIDNLQDSLFLRKTAEEITGVGRTAVALRQLVARLKVTMDKEGGIGIAAPQVGISKRIFLFTRVSDSNAPVQTVINPRILSHSEETFNFERDGCLSVPNLRGTSVRYVWIDVEYTILDGTVKRERLYGDQRPNFDGVIFQHEFDHLNGILFFDREP
jgi:peptide deformylase